MSPQVASARPLTRAEAKGRYRRAEKRIAEDAFNGHFASDRDLELRREAAFVLFPRDVWREEARDIARTCIGDPRKRARARLWLAADAAELGWPEPTGLDRLTESDRELLAQSMEVS